MASGATLCAHSINGGCKLGRACGNHHPASPDAARAEHKIKQTLAICTTAKCAGCARLHVNVYGTAARRAPVGMTPSKPVTPTKARERAPGRGERGSREGRGERGERGERGGRRERNKRDNTPPLVLLGRLRGKISAIQKAESAYDTLAATLSGPAADDARAKANRSREMQRDATAELERFAAQLDEYITQLGAQSEQDEQGEQSEQENRLSPDNSYDSI